MRTLEAERDDALPLRDALQWNLCVGDPRPARALPADCNGSGGIAGTRQRQIESGRFKAQARRDIRGGGDPRGRGRLVEQEPDAHGVDEAVAVPVLEHAPRLEHRLETGTRRLTRESGGRGRREDDHSGKRADERRRPAASIQDGTSHEVPRIRDW
jgi:hypothetical protein